MVWTEGTQVGGYVLGTQLGQGGMATVYKAHHPLLNRDVAIKVMHQNFLDDEGFVARFNREAQIVAKMSHPHIVPVYDFSEHNGQPYLVMKYIEGFTLKKQLIKNPPDLEGILEIMRAVGGALNYAHEQGVLHRDIKPSNIVIDRDGIPYLTDFGLARVVSSGESTMSADMLLGTPHYISPEQARGTQRLDGRTDIYSLGIVLYELLVGRVPFTGDSAFSIIHDHIYTPLPPPCEVNPEIPTQVETVLYKALAKQPEDRYETTTILIEDLSRAIREGDLNELDPNRAEIAAASLAKIRSDYEQQLKAQISGTGLTPVANIVQTGSMRSARMVSPKDPFYNQQRFWRISGCTSLLITAFLAIATLLSMAGTIMELNSLSKDSIAVEINFNDYHNLSSEYDPYGVSLNRDYPVPYIDVSQATLDNIPDNNNPISALMSMRHHYLAGDLAKAYETLFEHYPIKSVDRTIYLHSASRLALDVGDIDGAIISAIGMLQNARANDSHFEQVHAMATQLIYDYAPQMSDSDLTSTFEDLLDDRENIVAMSLFGIDFLDSSEFAPLALARWMITHDDFETAEEQLQTISSTLLQHEYNLLRAELALHLDNSDEARRLLNGILESDNAPNWVSTIASNYLNDME